MAEGIDTKYSGSYSLVSLHGMRSNIGKGVAMQIFFRLGRGYTTIYCVLEKGNEKMKVQKRDGRIVTYEADKITEAIRKANIEVTASQKANDELINEAIENVEKTTGDVIPVETIQDIIERTLVGHNKYVLAKKYMIYRYQRSLLR